MIMHKITKDTQIYHAYLPGHLLVLSLCLEWFMWCYDWLAIPKSNYLLLWVKICSSLVSTQETLMNYLPNKLMLRQIVLTFITFRHKTRLTGLNHHCRNDIVRAYLTQESFMSSVVRQLFPTCPAHKAGSSTPLPNQEQINISAY